jgi:hypothetical protein
VPVTPIGAHCRRCGGDFHLFEVRDQRTGTCPRCGWMLTADWTATLLDEAARADIAQRHLVLALRRLRNLPGNVAVRPHTVLRNLFEEIGWQEDLAEDPEILREELRKLRQHVTAWQLLDPVVIAAQPRRSWFQRAIAAITGREPHIDLASTGDAAVPDRDVVRPDGSRDLREVAAASA